MENLKKLIESVDRKEKAISKMENLSGRINDHKEASIEGYREHYNITFSGERKDRILALINEFIKEDKAELEPITTKLNLISDLLKDK